MTTSDTDIKKGRKFDQVLTGAREVFMAQGYEGASVDEIAKSAGVSKATLYSYFPDKRLLFAEVARQESQRQADGFMNEIDPSAPPEKVLFDAGWHLICFITSTFGQQVTGLCHSEATRFPELGKMFYSSGPGLVRKYFADYFQTAVEKGALRIDDTLLAADQFAELCKAGIFPRMSCGVQTTFTDDEKKVVLREAVAMFMARYGV